MPQPDSRTFSPKTTGIRLGSSQNVNVVLFSLACRKVSTLHKYFDIKPLASGWLRALENVAARAVEILWKVWRVRPSPGAIAALDRAGNRGPTAA